MHATTEHPSTTAAGALKGPTIMMASGGYFNFLEPDAGEFSLLDVAQSLSHLCRYNGHCRRFYSVAQHCVMLSEMVPAAYRREALLSELACAFVGDVAKPLKAMLPDYGSIELRIKRSVYNRIGAQPHLSTTVKQAKDELICEEMRSVYLQAGMGFDLSAPDSSSYTIADVAHALSNICRYTGHCHGFYSVAQHSVHVSRVVPPEDALAGLMHDAPEAFIGDVSKPLKILLPDYAEIERMVETSVLRRFGIETTLPKSVKLADVIMLRTEQRDIMKAESHVWSFANGVSPLQEKIVPMPPEAARDLFLARFAELTGTAAEPYPTLAEDCNMDLWTPERAKAEFIARLSDVGCL